MKLVVFKLYLWIFAAPYVHSTQSFHDGKMRNSAD